MGAMWFPDGWELDVPNPGYGELMVYAPTRPYSGRPLVDEDWSTTLNGEDMGKFLRLVTARALEIEPPMPDDLPAFITVAVARGLLPALQMAVALAMAGGERYDRTFRDSDEAPHEPYCALCGEGTYYTPGALPSTWCDQYGHTAYGMRVGVKWETAQDIQKSRREWWDRSHQELERRTTPVTPAVEG